MNSFVDGDLGILDPDSSWSHTKKNPEEIFDFTKVDVVTYPRHSDQKLILRDFVATFAGDFLEDLSNIDATLSNFHPESLDNFPILL